MSILAAGTIHLCEVEGDADETLAALAKVLEPLAGSEIETSMTEHAGQIYVHYRVRDDANLPDIEKKMSTHFRARQTILGLFRENSIRLSQQMAQGLGMHERRVT